MYEIRIWIKKRNLNIFVEDTAMIRTFAYLFLYPKMFLLDATSWSTLNEAKYFFGEIDTEVKVS